MQGVHRAHAARLPSAAVRSAKQTVRADLVQCVKATEVVTLAQVPHAGQHTSTSRYGLRNGGIGIRRVTDFDKFKCPQAPPNPWRNGRPALSTARL
jgi:hypothetical protein